MNTFTTIPAALVFALIVGAPSRACAGLFSDKFEVVAIAERSGSVPVALQRATSFVALDGGYVEVGDPIAGNDPPAAATIRQRLLASLAARGFKEDAASPSLLITYTWGIIRIDHRQIDPPYDIQKNLRSRIELVGTAKMAGEIENGILLRKGGVGIDPKYSSPRYFTDPLDAVIAHASRSRMFVVVSAYDFSSLGNHGDPVLVWRTKLSTDETSGDMQSTLTPMIDCGSRFLGLDSAEFNLVEADAGKAAAAVPASGPLPTAATYHLDPKDLDHLLKKIRETYSGGDD